jgi:hypothetical protein
MIFDSLGIFLAHLISAEGKQTANQKNPSSSSPPSAPHSAHATHPRHPSPTTSHHRYTSVRYNLFIKIR